MYSAGAFCTGHIVKIIRKFCHTHVEYDWCYRVSGLPFYEEALSCKMFSTKSLFWNFQTVDLNVSLTRKCPFPPPLRSLQRVDHLEIPASPLLLWQAVPLGLPPPPQHVALGTSAHGDYRTSLFCTSCNAFKSRDAPAATTVRSKRSDHMSFFRPHENRNRASREKNNMAGLQRQHFSCRNRTQKLAQSARIGDGSIKRALSSRWPRARGSLISQHSFIFAARLSFHFSSFKREKKNSLGHASSDWSLS